MSAIFSLAILKAAVNGQRQSFPVNLLAHDLQVAGLDEDQAGLAGYEEKSVRNPRRVRPLSWSTHTNPQPCCCTCRSSSLLMFLPSFETT